MSRSAKPAPDRTASRLYDEIENEFLGVWLHVARLREKVLPLLSGAEPRPRRIKSTAATSPASPYNP